MKKLFSCIVITLIFLNISPIDLESGQIDSVNNISKSNHEIKTRFDGYFTQNDGQIPFPDVAFHTKNAYFTPMGVIFRVIEKNANHLEYDHIGNPIINVKSSVNMHIYKMLFLGANQVIPAGKDQNSFNSNFFYGIDSEQWVTEVVNYNEIIYENLYENIDLIFRTGNNGLKYEFVVYPGGEVSDIKIKFDGVITSTDGKNLYLETSIGTITDGGLYVYQWSNEKEVSVNAKIFLQNNILSYYVDYNPAKILIIDPLIYSTFLGAGDEDKGFSIKMDSSNNAYVTGETWSLTFPTTTGAYNSTNNGSMDIFVLKLNSAGNNLLYSTYIGGSDNEEGRDIAIDGNNYAYITGYTESLDFPTTENAYNRTFGGGLYDVFVLKLNSAGSSLAYSTFMGGSDYERGFSIALDSANNAYVTGYTWSFNFPVVGGGINKTLNGWEDVFVFKLDSAGSNLLYSTYIGGFGIDYGYSIALDSSNNAYITGYTESLNFPSTTGAFNRANNGSGDIFVLKVNSAGNSLMYSTYIGGTDEDIGYSIAIDSSANAYVTGWTWSTDFPISSNAFKTELNNWSDVFIIKLNSLGNKLIYSTYLGGTNDDFGRAITLDSVNNAYITGSTISPDFPTTSDAIDRRYNSWEDAFVFILSASGSNMMYSSFIGGTDEDFGYSIALDQSNYGYVTGYTLSPNFPITSGAKDTIYNDYEDAFILKLKFPPKPDAPKNLSSRDGDGFVHLNWEPPTNVKKTSINNYIIYKGTSISDFNVFQVIDNMEYFNDTDVINGIKYYYAISAKNAMGEGNKSKIISAEPGAPPTKPINLKVSPGFDHIQLIWDAPENNKGFDVNSYIIYRGLSEVKLLVLDTIGNVTRYNDTNVDPGKIYYYSISAFNQKGESKRSDVITSAPGKPPTAPRNFTAEKINYYIFLTWSEPADNGGFNISRYRIYRGMDKNNLVLIGETDIISYVDTTSDIDMIYFYSVSAVNVKGEGVQTYLVLAKSGSVPPVPLLSGRVGENFVKLSWVLTNASSFEILYYKIYRGSTTSPLQLIAISNELTFYDYNVTVDIIYSYIVSAVNEKGEGLKSNIINARLMGLPSAPINITINAGDGYIFLSWSKPLDTGGMDIIYYNIYKSENEWELTLIANTSEAYLNDSQVINGINYYYVISAINAKGEGLKSKIVDALPWSLPREIQNLTVNSGDKKVTLYWHPPDTDNGSQILWFRIYRGISQDNISYIAKVLGTEFNDSSVDNGIFYFYRVSAVNIFGQGALSNIVQALPGAIANAPENLKTTINKGKIMLLWDPPRDTGGFSVEGYRIYRGISRDNLQEIAYVEDTVYTDKYFLKGIEYNYRVSAVTKNGEGSLTDISSITVREDGQVNDSDQTTGEKDDQNLFYIWIGLFVIIILVIIVIGARISRKRKLARKAKLTETDAIPETLTSSRVSTQITHESLTTKEAIPKATQFRYPTYQPVPSRSPTGLKQSVKLSVQEGVPAKEAIPLNNLPFASQPRVKRARKKIKPVYRK